MNTEPVPLVDLKALESDLRLASAYAARVGVLGDAKVLASLDAVEQSRSAEHVPNAHALTLALNQVAQAIMPMTLADLRSGRDPFEPKNQRRARGLQLCLAIAALITMLMIGHSMQSLRIEKAGLKALDQLQAMQPAKKVTELRRMAQFDNPLAKPNLSSDPYREKLGEWIAMYQARELLDAQIFEAKSTSMFPWSGLVDRLAQWQAEGGLGALRSAKAAAGAGTAEEDAAAAATAAAAAQNAQDGRDDDFCVRDASGAFKLPASLAERPDWVRNLRADLIDDLCFQYEVLQPITGSGSLNLTAQNVGRAVAVPAIESKVSMRSDWFLPFWFGCLGAIIFVMRNIASIRTPAMQLFPMVMRISLGGVAGIVIGWFSTSALPAFASTSALSVPFALAFLSGYGIDALFSVLDRMSRMAAAEPPPPQKS